MTKIARPIGTALLTLFALFPAACAGPPDVDKVAVGQDVALTKADGGVVEGKVTSRDDKNVQVTTGATKRSIPKDQVVDVKVVDKAKPLELPPAARFREYTIPEGTTLSLRLETGINSATSKIEDPVRATLAQAVSVGAAEVLPAGSTVSGTVSGVQASGKVKGLASIKVHFTDVAAAGRKDRYEIDATYSEIAESTKKSDATKIGIGAGAGAAIGGIVGGAGGAAKGAVIGGGAGTAVVLTTKGTEVQHAAGATLNVSLERAIDVRVPIE